MKLANEVIDEFLVKSSYTGSLILYYVNLRYRNKEAFKRSDLEQIGTGDYCHGYFVACCAFGLFDYTTKNDIINITYVNEHLSQEIKKNLYERAKKHDDKYPDSIKWIDDLTKVEGL
jgi:hypothetical protein